MDSFQTNLHCIPNHSGSFKLIFLWYCRLCIITGCRRIRIAIQLCDLSANVPACMSQQYNSNVGDDALISIYQSRYKDVLDSSSKPISYIQYCCWLYVHSHNFFFCHVKLMVFLLIQKEEASILITVKGFSMCTAVIYTGIFHQWPRNAAII